MLNRQHSAIESTRRYRYGGHGIPSRGSTANPAGVPPEGPSTSNGASSPNEEMTADDDMLDVNLSLSLMDEKTETINSDNKEKTNEVSIVEQELKNALDIMQQQNRDIENLENETKSLIVDSESRTKDFDFHGEVLRKLQHQAKNPKVPCRKTNDELSSMCEEAAKSTTQEIKSKTKIIQEKISGRREEVLENRETKQRAATLKRELEFLKSKTSSKFLEKEKADECLYSYRATLEKLQESLQTSADSLERKKKERASMLDTQRDEIGKLQEQLKEGERGLSTLQVQTEGLSRELDAANSKKVDLLNRNEDIDKLFLMIASKKETVKQLRETNAKLFSEKEAVSGEIIDLVAKRDTAFKDLYNTKKLCGELPKEEESILKLEAEYLCNKERISEYRALEAKWNDSLNSMQEKKILNDFRVRLEEMGKVIKEKEDHLSEINESTRKKKQEASDFQKQLSKLEADEAVKIEALEKEAKEKESVLTKLHAEIQKVKHAQKRSVEASESSNRKYSERLDVLRRVEILKVAHEALTYASEKGKELTDPANFIE